MMPAYTNGQPLPETQMIENKSFQIMDAMSTLPPPIHPTEQPPLHQTAVPPPRLLPTASPQTVRTAMTVASTNAVMPLPLPPDPNVITDSLRANMGLPPPPPTPPNQGPFGPSGLIPAPGGPPPPSQPLTPHQVAAELSPNQAMAVAAAAAAVAAEMQSPFKRPTNPPQPPPQDYNTMISPMNNNSFGLATAGNPLPTLTQAQENANQFALVAQQAAIAASVTAVGGRGQQQQQHVQPVPGLAPLQPPSPQQQQIQMAEEAINKIDMEVNESIVGAVIGQGGKSIVEIQQYSGTNIQISKKGNYSPGTRNRVVTITGWFLFILF